MQDNRSGRACGRWGRRIALSLSTVLASGLIVPAMAQDAPYKNLDGNGVDLTDGSFNANLLEGSIGSGQARLDLVRFNAATTNWSAAYLTQTVSGSTYTVTMVMGTLGDRFTGAVSGTTTLASSRATGATLTITPGGDYLYRYPDGSTITFGNPAGVPGGTSNLCDANNQNGCRLIATQASGKSGLDVTYAYDIHGNCSDFDDNGNQNCNYSSRLTSVSNDAAYAINFTYAYNGLINSHANPSAAWFQLTSSQFTNSSVSASSWPTVTYSYPASNTIAVTTAGGRTWRIANDSSGRVTAMRRPSASSDTTTVTYGANGVSSVTRDGVTTSYSRSVSGSTATMVVTDAQSNATTIVSDMTKYRPTTVTNALGKVTSLSYDSVGRQTEIAYPEGNKVQFSYDGRGNLTETRLKAKSGSGLADIVTTAGYDASCSNLLTCNSPNWTQDARGNQTDYAYDGATGAVTSITAPAATTGASRAQIRYGYTTNGAGIALPTTASQCQTGTAPTCVGTSDEVRSDASYDLNLNLVSSTTKSGDSSLVATTTAGYDAVGNLVSVDGPLTGSADSTTYRYDGDRLSVGAISPDPDGGGTRKRQAVKLTYNSDGQIAITEIGNVNGTSDGDWAAFVTAQQATATYDVNARKIKDVITANSITWQVNQYSYDSIGRLECTALRMNSAVWGSLPSSACSLGTTGGDGPDRIVKATYDAVGRVSKTTSAYGTADQADDAIATFTDNGSMASVTDAESNKTSYVYDGFDRLLRTYYPNAVKGAGTSSSADYEQLTYDAASNVTGLRLRDGQAIGYGFDNLDRVISKTTPGSAPNWDVTYSYDMLGRLTNATGDGWAVNAYGYDALGRVITEQNYNATTFHSYDLAGRQTRLTWADGFYVDYDYDLTDQVIAIRENGAASGAGVLATYGYDDLGRRTIVTRGNGTTTSYGYDGISRLTSLVHDLGGGAYDVTQTFAYNAAGQIKSQSRSNDAYAWVGHYNVNRAYGTNGLNQLTTAGATNLGYDGRGNLTSSGSDSYSYTAENQLTSGPGATLLYEPGGGQLLQLYNAATGADTRFTWSGSQMTSEISAADGALKKRYVPGPRVDETVVWYEGAGTGDRRWLSADERGSVVAVTNASGNVIGVNSYDEYGIPGVANIGRFQYTGQAWLPELGMSYYKARIYSPNLGRFMQTDPLGYVGGMNWYNYVGSDPINFSDPTGLRDCGVGEVAVLVPVPQYPTPGSLITVTAPKVFCVRLEGEGGSKGGAAGGGGGGVAGNAAQGNGNPPKKGPSKIAPRSCYTQNGMQICSREQTKEERCKAAKDTNKMLDVGGKAMTVTGAGLILATGKDLLNVFGATTGASVTLLTGSLGLYATMTEAQNCPGG